MQGRIADGWLEAVGQTRSLSRRQIVVGVALHTAVRRQIDDRDAGTVSVRELARDTGISRSAVDRALQAIERAGWSAYDAGEWWLTLRPDDRPEPPSGSGMHDCPACEGDGWVEVAPPPGDLGVAEQPWLAKCERCGGRGKLPGGQPELPPDPFDTGGNDGDASDHPF
jgi:hypothetical protein